MFRTIMCVLIVAILVAMPATMQAAPDDAATGATMWSDNFETGTVGSAPLATEPQTGSYAAPVTGDVTIVDVASAGFAAYEGANFMKVDRAASVGSIVANVATGSSTNNADIELTLPFYVSRGINTVRFLKDTTIGSIVGQLGFYGTGQSTKTAGAVAWFNGQTAQVVDLTQTFNPNAWNVLVVTHKNGTNTWSISINGQTAETETGNTTNGTQNTTGFAIMGSANNSTIYVDAARMSGGESTAVAEPISVSVGQRQLFLDDYCVAKMDGLQKTMHQPEKRGAVISPDRPWDQLIETNSAPAWDEKDQIYKTWMLNSTRTGPEQSDWGESLIAYAESKDGIDWTKPILRLRAFQGSQENNLLQIPSDVNGCVVYDPNSSDSSQRYKGLFLNVSNSNIRLEPTVSSDGIHWTKLNVPAIPSADQFNLSYDALTRTFIATVKVGGPYGRSQAIWTSKDFAAWTNSGIVFSADAEDQRLAKMNIQARLADPTLRQPRYNDPAVYNADIYNLGLFRYEGLYVGLPTVYHATGKESPTANNTDGFHLIQLASSRDLKTWQRLGDRQPFIGPSPVGQNAYDTLQILPPSAPVVRGDELWFYYTGLRHRIAPKTPDPKWGAVCLAVLRRDGFISLDAGDTPGTLMTKSFVLSGTKLFVNTDAAGGDCKVEVLDGQQKALAISEPVVGDQPRAGVQWKSGDLTGLNGKAISLRFTLRKAKLYSFWLDE